MIPELGQISLALALCISLALAALPLLGAQLGRSDWMAIARPAALGQLIFIGTAFVILGYAFLTDDFSVRFVSSNSSIALPVIYKLVAIWGGHEGSMLFWLALGDPLGDDAWALRVRYKPLIRFIWCGALLMALGGLLAMTDRQQGKIHRRGLP